MLTRRTPRPRSFLRSVFVFVLTPDRLWLLPIVLILLVIALLASVGALTPYLAFLYPL